MNVLQIKAAVRDRDSNRCANCGMSNQDHIGRYGRSLHVHRENPGSEYSTDPGACRTLCYACHAEIPKRPAGSDPNARTMVDIRARYIAPLEAIQDQMGFATMTETVNQAIREFVDRHQDLTQHRPHPHGHPPQPS